VPYTILYPDNRSSDLGVETEITGTDVTYINPCKTRFEDVELSAWRSCDAVIVRRVPIDANVIEKMERARIVVRMGVGFDVVDLETCGAAGIAAMKSSISRAAMGPAPSIRRLDCIPGS